MTTKFSVLLSVYKNENPNYFQLAIDSILNQSILPSEIVLVQDGKLTDELYKVCNFYQEKYPFFKIVSLKENVGLGKALAVGVLNCKYDLIARMDTDDIAEDNRFEIQLKEFEKDKDLALLGGYIEEFSNDVNNVHSIRKVPLSLLEIKAYAKKRNPFNHVTVMFKKQAVLSAGNYKTMYLSEDYYLWYRMIRKDFKVKNLPIVLVKVRADLDMIKRRGGIKYFIKESKLQTIFYKEGFISFKCLMSNLFIRLCFRIIPNSVRVFLYKKYLRKKDK